MKPLLSALITVLLTMSTQGSLENPNHHPILYLNDGNVILAALTASGETQLFCVHQSFLSAQSSVFADMFSLPVPNPVTHNEIYNGLPLVRMSDNAEDVESLLKALYDP
jgi:hypothetical protein